MSDVIRRFRGSAFFLSNMYEVPVRWDGRTYTCSESAYQSGKFLDPAVRDEFATLSGYQAKSKASAMTPREDWDIVKETVMEEVLRAKFAQNPNLRELLLSTGDSTLVERNYWGDTYWGIDEETGRGKNRLGVLLMKVRMLLGGEPYDPPPAPKPEEVLKPVARKQKADQIRAELEALPEPDFTGMEMGTKAFGRVRILRQEGDRLRFEAGGVEKTFVLPNCVLQGFLIPDDPAIAETFRRRQALQEELKQLERRPK